MCITGYNSLFSCILMIWHLRKVILLSQLKKECESILNYSSCHYEKILNTFLLPHSTYYEWYPRIQAQRVSLFTFK